MKYDFTFIDLFAGIGGFHIAMHELGGTCVYACELDENCRKTYSENFKNYRNESGILFNDDGQPTDRFCKDITEIDPKSIPDHNILCAGFPCQPFSQAGKKKGFEDTRGTLFFNVALIIKEKRPEAFFLENVRGLLKHDGGRTFQIISDTISELGYSLHYEIIKASDFNLPQHRPRLFMIGFRNDIKDDFLFPEKQPLKTTMSDVFDGTSVNKEIGYTLRVGGKGSPINDRRNWDGYLVDGIERRLTPREGKRMQGFPDDFSFPVSNAVAMKQLGNSVAVPAVQECAKNILKVLNSNGIIIKMEGKCYDDEICV